MTVGFGGFESCDDMTGTLMMRRRSESDRDVKLPKLHGAFGVANKLLKDTGLSALALESTKLSALQEEAYMQRKAPLDCAPLVVLPSLSQPESGHLSLHATVVEAGLLSEVAAADVALHLFHALAELHSRLVVHRNITPETVLITPNGGVVLSGYCHAAALDDTKALNQRVGTLGYLAPEVIIGEGSSLAVDAFGAGASLYFALAGQPPFQGDIQKRLQRTLRCKVPTKHLSLVSEPCQRTVKALMQRDPQDRPTMDELLAGPWWPSPVSHR